MNYVMAAIVILAVVVGVLWYRKRNAEQPHQIVSFVALLKEPQFIEPVILQTVAKKAWGADLGIEDETADGFIVGEAGIPATIINYQQKMILVNSFPTPYVEDPEAAAATIPDLRLQELFREHTAWLSCDAVGEIDFKNPDEIRNWYRLLGRLLCELVDDNCLAIFLPLTNQLFANMDETLEKLRSDDPLEELLEEAPVPVLQIGPDDPRMIAAVEKARATFPEFVAAFEQKDGESFGVKSPVTAGDNTEFIWTSVEAIENGVIYGRLANEPIDLGELKINSQVRVQVKDLNDWAYVDKVGEPHGLFTMEVLAKAESERQKQIDSE